MATYAIGDIQGCFDSLQGLLTKIEFDPTEDRLWFAGDLVNRGPDSLQVLRFVRDLGERAVAVLGNHDLHLLAVWQHRHRHHKTNDTLAPILDAADGEELLQWLRRLPLFHFDAQLNHAMLHAGLPPQWTVAEAGRYAAEVEEVLRGKRFHQFLEHMYGDKPKRWNPKLKGWERLRFIVNCLTRMRYCSTDGKLEFKSKGKPEPREDELMPWFSVPGRSSADTPIVFGHWSTLGLYRDDNVIGIDTGCLWGGTLTAYRLEDGAIFEYDCPESQSPS